MPSTLKTRTAPASVPLSPSSYALHHPASQIKENSPHRRSRPRVCASMKNRVRVSGTGFSNEASIRGGVSHPSIPLLGAAFSPHPQSRPTLRTAGSLQGVPPSCCGRRVAVWSGACSNGPSGFGEAATTRKQPANLAVEGAEESLSTLPDYAATVRPPPLLTIWIETCCNV